MLTRTETEEVLKDFTKHVITEARKNLTRQGKNAGRALYESLESHVEAFPNSIMTEIIMAFYGEFVDKGVSGTEVKYDTPYSFKSKGGRNGLKGMAPPQVFRDWIRIKGIRIRDEKGRFANNDRAAFAMAVSAQRKGFKPTNFISRPFELAFERLPDEIVEAYGLDLERFMNQVLQTDDGN